LQIKLRQFDTLCDEQLEQNIPSLYGNANEHTRSRVQLFLLFRGFAIFLRNPIQKVPLGLVSPDRLSALSCIEDTFFVHSAFAVTCGVYYYEVAFTDGRIRFGWATKEADLTKFRQIGDDRHSVGLDECIHRSHLLILITSLPPADSLYKSFILN